MRNKILFYTIILVHTPWTLIRIFLATIVIIDKWCDKILHGTLQDVKAELKEKPLQDVDETCPNCGGNKFFYDTPDDPYKERISCVECWTTVRVRT